MVLHIQSWTAMVFTDSFGFDSRCFLVRCRFACDQNHTLVIQTGDSGMVITSDSELVITELVIQTMVLLA